MLECVTCPVCELYLTETVTFMNDQKETIHILLQQEVVSPRMELLLGRGTWRTSQKQCVPGEGAGLCASPPGPPLPHLEAAELGGKGSERPGLSPEPPT